IGQNRLKAIFYIFCSLVLVFSITLSFALNNNLGSTEYPMFSSRQWTLSQYMEHSPIFISGNADFLAQAAIEGWSGTGSQEDPIIIADKKINYSANYLTRTLIEIQNTDLCFQIRNNLLQGGAETTITYGISLENVTHGNFEIINNSVLNNDIGIRVVSSGSNLTLVSNKIVNCDHGIYIESSHSTTINDNNIRDNTFGISLVGSKEIHLVTNTFSNNNVGITLKNIENTIIFGNNIYNHSLGIKLHTSTFNNWVQENDFIWNSFNFLASQAADDGTNNTFENNYWADWIHPDVNNDGIVDNPYPIDGEGGNFDFSPQTSPNNQWIIVAPPNPRLLSNSPLGVIYNLIVFLSFVFVMAAGSLVGLEILLPRMTQRGWILKLWITSVLNFTWSDTNQQSKFVRVAVGYIFVTMVCWYLLVTETTLGIIIINSSTLLTGFFPVDLLRIGFLSLFYLFVYPWALIDLFSALVISSTNIALWTFFICLSFVFIMAAVIIKLGRLKILQPRITKMISLDIKKIEEWIEAGVISDEKALDYVRSIKSLLQAEKDKYQARER
ncbi:MAG: nitrous oxide reductase family maturation protein NosD, partial [Promethearchaeota archaeon]